MVGEGRHFCRGLGIHTFRVPRQLRAPRGRVKAQVLDPNGHHVLGRWMSDCPSSCLPCHLVYTLLSRLCLPPHGGTSHDRLWTSNINKSGYIFHKHLYVCITSRTRPLPCGRVGETTSLWGHWFTTYTNVFRNPRHRIWSVSYFGKYIQYTIYDIL